MKISQFIKQLEKIKNMVWDITITWYDTNEPPVINDYFAKTHWYIEIER